MNNKKFIEKKCCRICGIEKELNEYWINNKKTGNRKTECKSCRNIKSILEYKKKQKENPDYFKNIAKEWRKNNPEKAKANCKKYRDNNKQKRNITCANWRKNNPEKSRAIVRKSYQKRRNTVKGKIEHRMEVQILKALKQNKKGRKWEILVGYNINQLKIHLESQFKDGMSWEFFMSGKIHIDHIIPKKVFQYSSFTDKEFKACWALKNLQPLWAKDNMSKGVKILFMPVITKNI